MTSVLKDDHVLKDALVTAFADVLNVSEASVNAVYVEDTTISIVNKAIIKVIMTPENLDEEKRILEKMGYSTLFVSEINDRLAPFNVTLLSTGKIERVHPPLG